MKSVVLCSFVVLSCAAFVAAQAPAGSYECNFTDPDTGHFYDVSGLMKEGGDYKFTSPPDQGSSTPKNYWINPCRQVVNSPCKPNTACCQQWAPDANSVASLGETTTARATAGATDEQKKNGGFTIQFTGGTLASGVARNFELEFICDPEAAEGDTGTPVYVNEAPQLHYNIKWVTGFACPVSPDGGLSGGSIVLIILVSVLFVYFVGGMIFMKFVKHAEGIEIIPNVEFWAAIPGLVKDGALFIGSKTCCRNQYAQQV